MNLGFQKREGKNHGEIRALRRAGKIPAILYSSAGTGDKIVIDNAEFQAFLRNVKPGRLPTTVFSLETQGGKKLRAVIKDIQYEPTSYRVSHIDFEELVAGKSVEVEVPILCVGADDCTGIKLGGFLRQVIRHVKVECLPEKIPQEFIVDVKDLGIKQSRKLKDLSLPGGAAYSRSSWRGCCHCNAAHNIRIID